MKSILIPTDFSPTSKQAIQYVLDLMGETIIPTRILLVNTYMVQHKDPKDIIRINDELKKQSKNGLEKEKEETLKKISNPNISVETVSHMGSLSNVILHLLKSENIDLVAIGKNNGKLLENVSGILKEQHCPLLIASPQECFSA